MMKTDAKKCIIKIASQEQHENVKNTRKTLKVLQQAAADKENLAGRPRYDKTIKNVNDDLMLQSRDGEKHEVKRKKITHKSIQTGEAVVTAEDLISEEPSADYWKRLAEKRGDALNDSLQENDKLKDDIENLQEENRICKEMLDESRNLVEVLQEMLEEGDTSTELGLEATEET